MKHSLEPGQDRRVIPDPDPDGDDGRSWQDKFRRPWPLLLRIRLAVITVGERDGQVGLDPNWADAPRFLFYFP